MNISLAINAVTRGLMAAGVIGSSRAGVPTPSLDLDFVNSSTLDSRITFSRASGATYFDSSGVLQTAASGVARFDHNPTTLAPLGLLIEEQRTNSIRNNTMVGAVAGTPGTLPTNWVIQGGGVGTLTQQVVGVGTQNGINYIDIKYSGTTSTTDLRVGFEPSTQITAATGQSWTASVYTAGVAGSLSNISAIENTIVERNSAGAFLGESGQAINTTNALVRSSISRTFNEVTAARVNSQIKISFSSGVAIDITLRIGLPQLELGAFATSVIPTTTAAATRNADAASMTGTNFSSWYRADEGTLYAEASTYDVSSGRTPFSITDGTVQNRIQVNSSTSPKAFVAVSGVTQLSQTVPSVTYTNNTFSKTALAYKTNDANTAANGTIGTDDTSITIPTVSEAGLGKVGAASNILNGTIRKIAFYPTRLSNEQLVALTTV